MYISRIVIRNFRNFEHLDVQLKQGVTCVIGENNTGKTNLLHAIRLAVDSNLSSQYRRLLQADVHSGIDLKRAGQVLISIEFRDYISVNPEHALLGGCEVDKNIARIHYRFRPKSGILEDISTGVNDGSNLSLSEDYHFQLTGGGKADPSEVSWNENLGSSLRFDHLQSFHIETLPALRDVTQSLRRAYESPLGRILDASDIEDVEKDSLIQIMRTANEEVEKQPTIRATGTALHESFNKSAGDAHPISLKLGMADPSFDSITRSLRVLMTNNSLTDFEPARNGLGLNNVLYISMILDYFDKRTVQKNAAGELLLIEEPEAHLHPQLQRVLYSTLAEKKYQAIVTTHSTHISSLAPTESFIVLTNDGSTATSGCVPAQIARLTPRDTADLDRFLDATRSTLLYARKVILVEGPSEMFLLPVLVKKVLGIDLDRHGISVIPIFGTHFEVYAKLFGSQSLRKKCVIITDGDLSPDELQGGIKEDDPIEEYSVNVEESEFVNVFQCPTTFERALTLQGTLSMILATVRECDYPKTLMAMEAAAKHLQSPECIPADKEKILNWFRGQTLVAAKRCGKGRFAQIASRHIEDVTELPAYMVAAIEWLLSDT